MPASPVSLTRLGQVALPAQDIGRAVAFYRDILGMRFLFEAPPKLAFFDCGGVRLMLAEPEPGQGGEEGRGSALYYMVDDLQAAHGALTSAGIHFEHGPHMIARLSDHELWMAFLRDSEGNLIGLMQEVRPG